MKTTIALLAILLTGCVTTSKQFEDDRVVILEGRVWVKDVDGMTPAEIRAVSDRYTVPVFDDAERAAWKRLLWGQGADVATTAVGLSLGCVELNPLGPGVAVAGKIWLASWYRNEAARTPAAFSVSKAGNASALVGGAAALWNLTQIPGC